MNATPMFLLAGPDMVVVAAQARIVDTRFIVTVERTAQPECRQIVVDADFDDIVCTNAFTGPAVVEQLAAEFAPAQYCGHEPGKA